VVHGRVVVEKDEEADNRSDKNTQQYSVLLFFVLDVFHEPLDVLHFSF
jgi:hypothetical protein